jgi:hypothetical protein
LRTEADENEITMIETNPHSNPYATPAELLHEARRNQTSSGLVESDAKHLFVTDPAELPERCVVTNTTDDLVRVSRQLYYIHPVTSFGVLLCGLPGVLILYLIFRKGVHVSYSINRAERFSKRIRSACSLICFLGGIGILIYGVNLSSAAGVISGIIVVVVSLFGIMVFSNTVVVTKHNTGVFRLKGCSPAFLASAMEDTDGPYHGERMPTD